MIVEVENLKKSIDGKPVLNGVSFKVDEGEVFALIGPNGVGKTTTFKCIYGGIDPDEGTVRVFGKNPITDIKKRIAVLNEERRTFRGFKGRELLNLWKLLYPDFDDSIFSKIILHFNVDLSVEFKNYSVGMKTVLLLALVFSSGADLMILDEPTQFLDPVIRSEIMDLIRKFSQSRRKTVLISSHEIYELEEIADSFAVMYEGEILYSDTVDGAKELHRVISSGEEVPVGGKIVGLLDREILIKTEEDVGRNPTFKEIVLGYLSGRKSLELFKSEEDGIIL